MSNRKYSEKFFKNNILFYKIMWGFALFKKIPTSVCVVAT